MWITPDHSSLLHHLLGGTVNIASANLISFPVGLQLPAGANGGTNYLSQVVVYGQVNTLLPVSMCVCVCVWGGGGGAKNKKVNFKPLLLEPNVLFCPHLEPWDVAE